MEVNKVGTYSRIFSAVCEESACSTTLAVWFRGLTPIDSQWKPETSGAAGPPPKAGGRSGWSSAKVLRKYVGGTTTICRGKSADVSHAACHKSKSTGNSLGSIASVVNVSALSPSGTAIQSPDVIAEPISHGQII